jgi:glycolate oxidase FAD binding subunit
LAEIEAALAERKQMLAFEPPHFGDGIHLRRRGRRPVRSAPRQQRRAARLRAGREADGREGEVLNFGGQVMKNVAGYDVSRLLAGSMGTLGLLLEVSVKVLPRPYAKPRCASR